MNKLFDLLISAIIPKILEWLWALWSRLRNRKEIQEKNKKVVEDLKNAETPEERDQSARNVINNF